jgi:tetratricopeptide (TPR) repeat protein
MEHSHLVAVAMMTTAAAIDCNNLGADLLQAGHPKEALQAFQEATKLTQPISGGLHFEATRNESIPAPEALQVVFFKLKERVQRLNLLLVLLIAKQPHALEKLDYDHSSMLFTAPMKISILNYGPESCTILAGTLLYNVALTFHLHGSEKSVRTSARLFERAYSSLAYAERMEDGSKKRYLEKLRMASLNNSGHIHHKLGNYQAARQHLASLFEFVLSLPASLSSEDMSERQAVLCNAFLLQEPSIAAAAA